MKFVLQCLIDFVSIFIIIYFIYKFFINKKRKDYESLKKSSEVRIIIDRYKLDMKKIRYKKLLNDIALINSIIIAFTSTIVINIKSLALSVLVGLATIMLLTYALYEILGNYYNRKEDDKNVQYKRNRK